MIIDYSGSLIDYFKSIQGKASVFFFAGNRPTQLNDITFDTTNSNDVMAQCLAVSCVDSYEKENGRTFAFNADSYPMLRKGAGQLQNNDGIFRAIPDNVTFSHPELGKSATSKGHELQYLPHIFDFATSNSVFSGLIEAPAGGDSEEVTIEFEFNQAQSVTGINVQTSNNSNHTRPLDIEYHDGNDWVRLAGWSVEDVTNGVAITYGTGVAGGKVIDFGQTVVASRFRFKMPDNSVGAGGNGFTKMWLRSVHFILSQLPNSQTLADATWAMAVLHDEDPVEGEPVAMFFSVGDYRDILVDMAVANKSVEAMTPIRPAYCHIKFPMMET